MHVAELINSIDIIRKPIKRSNWFKTVLGEVELNHLHSKNLLELDFGDQTLNDYLIKLFAIPAMGCEYFNFSISGLIKCSTHQLTMRRFPHTGSQTFVQMGAYTGEEFLLGTIKNIGLEGYLVCEHIDPIIAEKFVSYNAYPSKSVKIIPTNPLNFIENFDRNIGEMVIANIQNAEVLDEIIGKSWNLLDRYANIILSDNPVVLQEFYDQSQYQKYISSPVRVINNIPNWDNGALLVLQKEKHIYSELIAHDER